LGHFSTETTRIYEVPSIDMMRKVMESGNLESDEKPLWTDDEAAPEISPIISTP
jgi:integrase/recombinase XerD